MASVLLKKGGRLVYLYPVKRNHWKPEDLPSHESFRLIDICENPLSAKNCRICIVMEKLQ